MNFQSDFPPNSLRFTWFDGGVTPVPLGHSTGWRTLPVALVTQAVGGTGLLRISKTETISVPAGRALFVPPRLHHRIDVTSSKGYVSRWAHFSQTLCGTIDIFSFFDIPFLLPPMASQEIGELCEANVTTHNAHSPSLIEAIELQSRGFHLSNTLLSLACPRNSTHSFQDFMRVLPVLRHIEENLSRELNRNDLARLLHLSPTRFHYIFKEIMGESPLAFCHRLRLEQATRLLAGSSLSISEVGQSVGFSDSFHFSRIFKARTGLSPLHFRESLKRTTKFA